MLGAPELSKRLGIPRTTVFRLLQTLESLGFLERADKDRNYKLGIAVLRLGFEYLVSLELTDLGLPVIESLRDATGFTTHIVIRDGRDVVFVAKAQSQAPVFSSIRVNVGTRLPAHATTHGHVLMGDLSLKELHALYPEGALNRMTNATPETVDALYEVIREDDAARLRRQQFVVRARHLGGHRAGAQRDAEDRRVHHRDGAEAGNRRGADRGRPDRQGAARGGGTVAAAQLPLG